MNINALDSYLNIQLPALGFYKIYLSLLLFNQINIFSKDFQLISTKKKGIYPILENKISLKGNSILY